MESYRGRYNNIAITMFKNKQFDSSPNVNVYFRHSNNMYANYIYLYILGMVGINEGAISAAEAAFGGIKVIFFYTRQNHINHSTFYASKYLLCNYNTDTQIQKSILYRKTDFNKSC